MRANIQTPSRPQEENSGRSGDERPRKNAVGGTGGARPLRRRRRRLGAKAKVIRFVSGARTPRARPTRAAALPAQVNQSTGRQARKSTRRRRLLLLRQPFWRKCTDRFRLLFFFFPIRRWSSRRPLFVPAVGRWPGSQGALSLSTRRAGGQLRTRAGRRTDTARPPAHGPQGRLLHAS